MIDDNKANANPQGPPSVLLRPRLGEALVFGGDVQRAASNPGAAYARAREQRTASAPPSAPPTRPALLPCLAQVTHAGMPVEAGLRSVLVASFSTRTPASAADRVNGLQAGSSSGSLREYSF